MDRRRLIMRCLEESPPIVYYSSENGFESDLSGNGVVLNRIGGAINDDGTLHLSANTYNYAYIFLEPLGIVSDGNHTIEFKFSFPADIFSVSGEKWIFTPSAKRNHQGGNGWYGSIIVGTSAAGLISAGGQNLITQNATTGFEKDVIYTLRYTYDAGVIHLSINDIAFDFVKTYEPDIALFGKSMHNSSFTNYIPEMNIYSIKIWKGEI